MSCFQPTSYVMCGVTCTHKCNDLFQATPRHSVQNKLLILYGSTVLYYAQSSTIHYNSTVRTIIMYLVISGQFFSA